MANKLNALVAEAVTMLQATNPQAWDILEKYFQRQYDFEKTQCVDSNLSEVEIHRGQARAWRDAVNLYKDATKKLSSGK